jgi:outer membrane lipoprotein SlyB
MNKSLLGLILTTGLMTACASNINSDHYATSSTGKVSTVSQCTVLNVRYVGVNSDSGAGTMIGGIAGGVAGSTIGGGSTAHTLGAVGGALLGGLVGSAAEQGLSSQTGIEYVVRLDNGQVISITQGTAQPLAVGQRCMVLFGNPSRIIAQ